MNGLESLCNDEFVDLYKFYIPLVKQCQLIKHLINSKFDFILGGSKESLFCVRYLGQ